MGNFCNTLSHFVGETIRLVFPFHGAAGSGWVEYMAHIRG